MAKYPPLIQSYIDAGLAPAFVLSLLGKRPRANKTEQRRRQPPPKPPEVPSTARRSPAPPSDTVERRPWPTKEETAEQRVAALAKSGKVPPRKRRKPQRQAQVKLYVATKDVAALAPSYGHTSTGVA